MTDLFDAAEALQQRKNQKVETAVGGASGRKTPLKRSSKPRGTSAAQARKTERKGPSGERQFGAPLSTPSPDLDRAIDAEVSKLRQRQSTDSSN